MITEQNVNKIIENACNYYLLAVKQEIEFIKNKISTLNTTSKKFNYIINFAEKIGYDYTDDLSISQ
jgi:hypothetical protein